MPTLKEAHERLYKTCLIILAALIAVFNVYGVLFLGPVYLLLSISFTRYESGMSQKAKNRWITIPIASALFIILTLIVLY